MNPLRNWRKSKSLRHLPKVLTEETGTPTIGAHLASAPHPGAPAVRGLYIKYPVGKFLSQRRHQHGCWYIDGGWGGPPGPITVQWNETTGAWDNLGFGASRRSP